MSYSFDIKPGTWANVSTNVQIEINKGKGEKADLVKSPVFVISREKRYNWKTFMCVDQRSNLLVWKFNSLEQHKFGTLSCSADVGLCLAKVTAVVKDCVPSEQERHILTHAKERRSAFIANNPKLEKCFFKLSEDSKGESKDEQKSDGKSSSEHKESGNASSASTTTTSSSSS